MLVANFGIANVTCLILPGLAAWMPHIDITNQKTCIFVLKGPCESEWYIRLRVRPGRSRPRKAWFHIE